MVPRLKYKSSEMAEPLQTGADIAKAFDGEITPNRVSFHYRLALAGVAFALVLMPAIYFATIALIGLGIVAYTTGLGVTLRLAIGVILLVVVAALLKPLFARSQKKSEAITLDPCDDPLLYTLVEAICRQIRAPMPSWIEVNCEVNASARLRRGLLSKDLVLTIGLPLAACLDMRQFAGIIAHELGHFAQGAGMRFAYVIQTNTVWLSHVLNAWDRFDRGLKRLSHKRSIIGVVFLLVRLCLWLPREMMMALMRSGHEMGCVLLRQMEFDADVHEAKLVGSDVFEATMKRIRTIQDASRSVDEDVERNWAQKKLPDNLPLLIERKAQSHMPVPIDPRMHADPHETHPPDALRLRAVRELKEPGVFHVRRPASELFSDLAALSRTATRDHFKGETKYAIADGTVVPAEEIWREIEAYRERKYAIIRFYVYVPFVYAPLSGRTQDAASKSNGLSPLLLWRDAKALAMRLNEEAEQASIKCLLNENRIKELTVAINLLRARIDADTAHLDLPLTFSLNAKRDAAIAARDKCVADSPTLSSDMDPFSAATRERITRAIDMADAGDAGDGAQKQEALRLMALCRRVEPQLPMIAKAHAEIAAANALLEWRSLAPDRDEADRMMAELVQSVVAMTGQMQAGLADIPELGPDSDEPEASSEARLRGSDAYLAKLESFHFDRLGDLLVIVGRVEERAEVEAKV
jgi:Zn-dependent protease with chaperone function